MLRDDRHCSPQGSSLRSAPARVLASGRVAFACAVALALCLTGPARSAWAGAGSGSAGIAPSATVTAGATGTWTVTYIAAEDFATTGGMIEVNIPVGWTAPQ